MNHRQPSCPRHEPGCASYANCGGKCITHIPSETRPYSACTNALLRITAKRLFLLHPLLVALDIPEEVMCDQLVSNDRMVSRWCVERLLDAGGSHASIEEAVESLTTRHLFRRYTHRGRVLDSSIDHLIDDHFSEHIAFYDDRSCSCGSILPTEWAVERDMMYTSLATFLLSHQCLNQACVGCITLTLAIFNRRELVYAERSMVTTPYFCRTVGYSLRIPLLQWIVQTPDREVVKCYPVALVSSGCDLTPFFSLATWEIIISLMPKMRTIKLGTDVDLVDAIRLFVGMLDLVDMTTIIRTLDVLREQHTSAYPPTTALFAACSSRFCGPLLWPFVCGFVSACTRDDLFARWYTRSKMMIRNTVAGRAILLMDALKGDTFVDELVLMLREKLSPADLLSTLYGASSIFVAVCARASCDVVVSTYDYVKDEMASAGMSLAVPHKRSMPYDKDGDYLYNAVRYNTVDVCAALFAVARAEDPHMTALMRPRWTEAAETWDRPCIMEIFKAHQMVKGAM